MDSQTLALAAFLVREHDAAASAAHRARTLPTMAAEAEGRLRGIDTALAYIAGYNDHKDAESLIAAVRALSPRVLAAPPELVEDTRCLASGTGGRCTRVIGHWGQHIATMGYPWPNPAPDDSPTIERAMDGDR